MSTTNGECDEQGDRGSDESAFSLGVSIILTKEFLLIGKYSLEKKRTIRQHFLDDGVVVPNI
jgi:hypothetical protein